MDERSGLALRELAKLVNVPAGLGIRATFKADLSRDPIRKDPRFDQLAAQPLKYLQTRWLYSLTNYANSSDLRQAHHACRL